MLKQIACLTLLIFLFSFVSAVEVYSGESYEIVIQEPYEFYSIVGNSTAIDLSVELDGLNATITFGNYVNDNFNLIFFNKDKEIITVYESSGSGGGSNTIYRDRNVTEYVDRNVTVEVPGKTNEVEKVVNKTNIPWYVWVAFLVLIGFIIYLIFGGRNEDDEDPIIIPPSEDKPDDKPEVEKKKEILDIIKEPKEEFKEVPTLVSNETVARRYE